MRRSGPAAPIASRCHDIIARLFERDMQVTDIKSGRKVRLGNAQKLFGQDRETLDIAYAGDILALVGNYEFLIGDTLTSESGIVYDEMPRFKPECFSYLFNNEYTKYSDTIQVI